MHFRYALRQEALQQMQGMRETSIALNKFSYTAALSACEKGYTAACLRWLLHRSSWVFWVATLPLTVAWGYQWSVAQLLLLEMPVHKAWNRGLIFTKNLHLVAFVKSLMSVLWKVMSDIICHNAFISACAACSEWQEALHCLCRMEHRDQISG